MSETSGPFLASRFSGRQIPMLEITFAVMRPNGQYFERQEMFWVDSGFDGDLKMPQSFGNQLKGMGIPLIPVGGVKNASGSITIEIVKAKILRISLNGIMIPINNSIDCVLNCFGTNDTAPLVGLNALSRWKVCLDIPNANLSISS